MHAFSQPVGIPEKLLKLLQEPAAVKAVGTVNPDGSPYVSVNTTLTSLDGKSLILSEDLEKSVSNVNLVNSVWFGRTVCVTVSYGEASFAIKARVHRCLIVGKIFEQMLARKRNAYGDDADISTVWELLPLEISETSPAVLRRRQEKEHPYFDRHLDRSSIKA
ncbi:hypothetical protein [Caproiciproducens sp. CPB-2]|uniref:hypothetical protein n=1 Tax=Caproiciproducens sp. CPB-2 TaxID=3030017 RepID=UPI0023DB9F57|nr:hypothetical protein [Caproiciproducens sp. CPB-2]MDF1493396.1 hypothetical protein [Caproiciproducens sp. CPB-2]